MSKPVFVLLHGAWHTPKCWSRLVTERGSLCYKSVTPALLYSNDDPFPKDWSEDINTIRKLVSELVDEHEVIVVIHSSSGMTSGTALNGRDKQACASEGLRGGVIRLIYIAAFPVPEGFQHSPRGTRDNMIPEMKTDFDVRVYPNSNHFPRN